MIGVGIPATTTSRGIGRVATLADMEPGAVAGNGPAFLSSGGGIVTTTPTANAVPQAGEDGKLALGWIPSALFNTIVTLTTSGTFTAQKTGLYYAVVQAAGGPGMNSNRQESGDPWSGGGGGGGGCSHGFVSLTAGQTVTVVIGAGGIYSTTDGSGLPGTDGGTSSFGEISATGGKASIGEQGGAGGTGNLSDGQPGGSGMYTTSGSRLPGGVGGASFLGKGAASASFIASSMARVPATSPTKGGGGGGSSGYPSPWEAANQRGSSGANGIIMLMYNS